MVFKDEGRSTKLNLVFGVLAAFIGGCTLPLYSLVLGYIAYIYDPDPEITAEERSEAMRKFLIITFGSALGQLVLGYLQYSCLQSAAERLAFNLRGRYLDALMQ